MPAVEWVVSPLSGSVFSRSKVLVRMERQAWEVTGPAGWGPSESALRLTWSVGSGKLGRARLMWVVPPHTAGRVAALVDRSVWVSRSEWPADRVAVCRGRRLGVSILTGYPLDLGVLSLLCGLRGRMLLVGTCLAGSAASLGTPGLIRVRVGGSLIRVGGLAPDLGPWGVVASLSECPSICVVNIPRRWGPWHLE